MHIREIPDLDAAGLRRFALIMAGTIALVFGALLPYLFTLDYPRWPWFVAGLFVVVGILAPNGLAPVYRAWMRFGLLLNRVTTPCFLGIVYFVVFTPVSLAMKLGRRDVMHRKFESHAASYRVRVERRPADHMDKPF